MEMGRPEVHTFALKHVVHGIAHIYPIFHFSEKEMGSQHRNRYPEILVKEYILIPGPHSS